MACENKKEFKKMLRYSKDESTDHQRIFFYTILCFDYNYNNFQRKRYQYDKEYY